MSPNTLAAVLVTTEWVAQHTTDAGGRVIDNKTPIVLYATSR